MKTLPVTSRHVSLMDAFKKAVGEHQDLTAVDVLAVASQLVGNLVALQDQTRITSAMAMELVATNIEMGNRTAVETLLRETAGNA